MDAPAVRPVDEDETPVAVGQTTSEGETTGEATTGPTRASQTGASPVAGACGRTAVRVGSPRKSGQGAVPPAWAWSAASSASAASAAVA